MRWGDLSGKLSFQLIVLACVLAINAAFFFTFDFTGALERRDNDAPQYTMQMQDLLQHHPTPLMWPQYRVLVPALSIAVSAVLHTSYRISMQILSATFMLLLVVFFYLGGRVDRRRAFLLCAVFLSFPAVMLFSLTYWIELPFLAALTVSFWLWDRFIHSGKASDLLLTIVCSVAGLLIKEAFLVHVLAMGAYLVLFHRTRVRRILPYYALLAFLLAGLYYLNYEIIFNSQKTWITGAVTTNTVSANFHGIHLSDFAKYLNPGRGGFLHVAANLLLALGGVHALAAFLWWKDTARGRMLVYGLLLLAFLVFITFNIAVEMRYVLLCIAPSYLLLIAKRIGSWENNARLGLFLGGNYLAGLAGAVAYSLLQHGVF